MDKASLELLLGQGLSVERIAKRFGKHPSTVSYWLTKHGLEAVGHEKHSAKGGVSRERLQGLVESGMTVAELGEELGRSSGTVRYWLARYGLRTAASPDPNRTETTGAARNAGLVTIEMSCKLHGETEFVLEGRGYYRCKRCRSEAVTRRRQRVKLVLIAEAGGCCRICGYNAHPAALEFHHIDPNQKRLVVSARGVGLGLDTLREEARKCVLLCSNCHVEVERGAAELPVDS
jgi:transposase-like protein